MKKLLVVLCAVTFVLGVVTVAGAMPITFSDTTQFFADNVDPTGDLVSYGGEYVNELEYRRDWVTWTHHFGFDPAAAEVLSGTVTLSLRDDVDSPHWPIALR